MIVFRTGSNLPAEKTEDEVRMSTIRCPSCSAPSDDEGGKKYNICNHCRALYLFDGTGSYIPSYTEAKLKESDAIRRIHEWASDVKGGREFSRNIELARMSLKHLPLYIYRKDRTGNDTEVVVSGIPSIQPGIRQIDPAGIQKTQVTADTDMSDFQMPNTDPQAYTQILSVDPGSRQLLFYPFWITQYVYRGKLNTITVDAHNGSVYGDLNVEVERKNPLPLTAGSFAIIFAEGFIAFFGIFYALAAIGMTAAGIVFYTNRRKE